MKKLFAIVLVLMLAVTSFALAEDASVEYILNEGKLILGLDDSFPPMGYRDEDNNIIGFDIDLAKEVAARLGVELVAQPVDWDAKETELNEKHIDCIWNGLSITADRQESMSMTFAYLNNQIMVYALADSGIATLDDLAGKQVATQIGSYALELLEGDYAEMAEGFGAVIECADYMVALQELLQGTVDAVAMDMVVGNYYINEMKADNIVAVASLEDDLYGIAFRKTDVALCAKVQEILKEMKKDGKMAEISEAWFGTDITVVPAE